MLAMSVKELKAVRKKLVALEDKISEVYQWEQPAYPREALGFAGSLGSLARYAGMALGITVASNILYGQMSVAMGEAVTSFVAGRPDVFLFGFRSVFYVLMAVAAVGFALAIVRLVKMRARH